MTYDRNTAGSGPLTLGRDGHAIDVSAQDYEVPDSVKAITVATAGDIVCRPVGAEADITLTGWPASAVLPWHCSHIRQTGTTATLATVEG